MKKIIYKSIFYVSIIMVIISTLSISLLFKHYFTEMKINELTAQANLIGKGIDDDGVNYLKNLNLDRLRVTVMKPDGKVLYDTSAKISKMDNHLNRDEVKKALDLGKGTSTRFSETLLTQYIYTAIKTDKGIIVRVAIKSRFIETIIWDVIPLIILILLIIAIVSLIVASRISKQIVKPLNKINLNNPIENDGYEEIVPLLRRIHKQKNEITNKELALQQKMTEFEVVTDNMKEGLVLLNKKGNIIEINNSAMKLFNCDHSIVGENFLALNRDFYIAKLMKESLTGKEEREKVKINSRDYQLRFSPVMYNDKLAGTVLLVVDITDREQAEKMRREFSANVSHELKTPLHSILGCSELLMNNLVKKEDINKFNKQIYNETKRMISLVEDIIKLSSLDEGVPVENKEKVNLKNICNLVVNQLTPVAKEKNVDLKVSGDDLTINCIPQLMEGVIYNLCDNGIKYNKPNGNVELFIKKQGNEAIIEVKDTGIGIPKGEENRIFERFYRIDKSHSKEVGGTGLGLSIVKHSVMLNKGRIEVKSKLNEGTDIKIYLPIEE